jgi:hypothetical protein
MRAMNYAVDAEHRDVAAVAREFLDALDRAGGRKTYAAEPAEGAAGFLQSAVGQGVRPAAGGRP